MPLYTPADFERIAAANAVPVATVKGRAPQFESAATWLRSDRGDMTEDARREHLARRGIDSAPLVRSRTPSAQLKTLQKIANSAARLRKNLEPGFTTRARVDANLQTLLRHLTIKSREAAEDGPGDPEILHLLAFAEGSTEDHVLDVIRTIVDGALEQRKRAAAELERLAREAGPRVRRVGELTVPLGNRGEWEVNDWLGKMLSLYPDLTGRSPGTSIGGPESDNKGQAYGPLIRFLIAAGRPVGLSYTPQAWRARVRALLAEAALQK